MNVRNQLELDRHTVYIGTLLLSVQTVAVWFVYKAMSVGVSVETPDQVAGAGSSAAAQGGTGLLWVAIEVAFAIALLLAYFMYKRGPEWLQKVARWNAILFVAMYLGAANANQFLLAWAIWGGIVTLYIVTDQFGVWWTINNLLAWCFAVVGAVGIGLIFTPLTIFLALLGLMVYDHVFANKKDWMFSLADGLINARLPVLFVKPSTWRFSWDSVTEKLGGEDSDAWALGTADVMLPAGFVASLAQHYGPSTIGLFAVGVTGLMVALSSLRLRWLMVTKHSGAGLPPITASIALAYLPLLFVA